MAQDPLSLIAKRKAEMEASRAKEQAERARLDEEAAARAKEEEEIAIAEKVFARLAAQQEATPSPTSTPSPSTPSSAPEAPASAGSSRMPANTAKIPAAGGTKRPKGIPTVPQMVAQLLEEAETRGVKGLRSGEIMEGINERWWPGVSVNLVMPTVYRCISRDYYFGKQGKLIVRLRDRDPPKREGEQLKLQ